MPQTLTRPIVHNGWAFVRQFLLPAGSGSSTPLPEFPPNEGLRSRDLSVFKASNSSASPARLHRPSSSQSVKECGKMRGESSSVSSDPSPRGGAAAADTDRRWSDHDDRNFTVCAPIHGWRPRRARISRHEFKYLSFWESRGAADRRRSHLKLGL